MVRRSQQTALSPVQQAALTSYCEVCFVSFSQVRPKHLPEGTEVLLCSKCGCCTHRGCYDMESNFTFISESLKEFICERCEAPANVAACCVVCRGTKGVFKCMDKGEMVHIFCGLIHPDIDVVQYYPSITFQKNPLFQTADSACHLCGKPNADSKCAMDSCHQKSHAYCSRQAFKIAELENEEPKSWNFHMSMGSSGSFDVSDELLRYDAFKQEFDEQFRQFSSFKMGLPLPDSICQQNFEKEVSETKERRRASKKIRRGGFCYVLCDDHQSDIFCNCLMKGTGEMIFCDCCFEWYHFSCLGCDPSMTVSEKFVCPFCKTFYDLKRRLVEQVVSGRPENYEIKLEPYLRLSLIDYVWVMRCIDQRIAAGASVKMLKELPKYPLKTSRMRNYLRPKLTGQIQTCLQDYLRSPSHLDALRLEPVLALTAGSPVTLYQNLRVNAEIGAYIRFCSQFMQAKGWDNCFKDLMRQLEFKQRAVSDSYETIIELSSTQQKYPQIPVLKLKAQNYSFLEILKKVNEGSPVPLQALIDALEDARLKLAHSPEATFRPLVTKCEEAANRINNLNRLLKSDPQQTTSIRAAVQALSDLNVLPPPMYYTYLAEREFINAIWRLHSLPTDQNVSSKIETLIGLPALPATQELSVIIMAHKPTDPTLEVWPKFRLIFQRQLLAIAQQDVKGFLAKGSAHASKLSECVNRAIAYNLHEIDAGIGVFCSSWQNLSELYKRTVHSDLTLCDNISAISQKSALVNSLLLELPKFTVRIEGDVGKASWLEQGQLRQQEVSDLMVLLTEAQQDKNPLTLKRILPTLPRDNQLVQQYQTLKKQQAALRTQLQAMRAKSKEKMDFFTTDQKKVRRDQIKENAEKPSIEQVNKLSQAMRQSGVNMTRQIEELEKMKATTIEIQALTNEFLRSRKVEFANQSEIVQILRDIDDYRKKVLIQAELALKKETIHLYHVEICTRMRQCFLSPNLDLNKSAKLLKYAEEEDLTKHETYEKLKDRYENKNKKTKETSSVKQYEAMLLAEAQKETDPAFTHLFTLRRGLALPDLHIEKTRNEYIDSLEDKNRSLRERISQILQQRPSKHELLSVRSVLLEALKNPYFQPDIARLHSEFEKASNLLKRWKDLAKSSATTDFLIQEYYSLIFTLEEVEQTRSELDSQAKALEAFKNKTGDFNLATAYEIESIMERLQVNQYLRDSRLYHDARRQYLEVWVGYVKQIAISTNRDNFFVKTVPYEKIKRLTMEAYHHLQQSLRKKLGDETSIFYQNIIPYLEQLMGRIKRNYNPQLIKERNFIMERFVDVEELHYELTMGSNLEEQIQILQPYKDLNDFKLKKLHSSSAIETKPKSEQPSALKRPHPTATMEAGDSDSEISVHVGPAVPSTVTDNQRKQVRDILLNSISRNPQLKQSGDYQSGMQSIEATIYEKWPTNIVKYLETSEEYEKLFIKLVNCPNLSQKVVKNKFEAKFLQLLIQNLSNIADYEAMIASKIKEQEQKNLEQITRSAESFSQGSVLELLTTGQGKEALKGKLDVEMKIMREAKSKKRRRNRSRSRSRSPSEQQRFSSDSQRQVPSYIQKEYTSNAVNGPFSRMMNPTMFMDHAVGMQRPLLYDPDEDEKEAQITIPRDAALSIKKVILEMQLKKRGRVEVEGIMLTCEDFRKVKAELLDPACDRLTLRKDKPEIEIIQYLNRPSKRRFKYLVGWLQAVDPQNNEMLRELSQEAAERHRVFGWQNEHIKIHVMSIKQITQVPKLAPFPGKVSSEDIASVLSQDRLVYVIQYPAEKMFQLRESFKPFEGITEMKKAVAVEVPPAMLPPMELDKPFPSPFDMLPQMKSPLHQLDRSGEFQNQRWQAQVPQITPMVASLPLPKPPIANQNNIIRMMLNFSEFEPILSDEQNETDEKPEAQKKDLATSLLDHIRRTQQLKDEGLSNNNSSNNPANIGLPNMSRYQIDPVPKKRFQPDPSGNPQSASAPILSNAANPNAPLPGRRFEQQPHGYQGDQQSNINNSSNKPIYPGYYMPRPFIPHPGMQQGWGPYQNPPNSVPNPMMSYGMMYKQMPLNDGMGHGIHHGISHSSSNNPMMPHSNQQHMNPMMPPILNPMMPMPNNNNPQLRNNPNNPINNNPNNARRQGNNSNYPNSYPDGNY